MRAGQCVVVSLLLSGVLSCAPEVAPALAPVKVGVIASTRGALGTFGEALLRSIELAAEQVNASGGVFDGRALELVTKDSASEPETAARAARDLLSDGVVAVVGPETSGQAAAVLDVLSPSQVPMVSCCATSASLSANNAPGSGFFFRTAPSDALQGKALAYLAERGVSDDNLDFAACTQAAVFVRADPYGQGFQRVFCENFAGTASCDDPRVVVAQSFSREQPSLGEIDTDARAFADAIVAAARPAEELCIVFITFGFEGARLVGEVERRLSTSPLSYHYLTGDGAQETAFLRELANAPTSVRTRLWGTVPFHAVSPAYDRFETAFVTRYDQAPTAYAAHAFDAMFITALAITHARSTAGTQVQNSLFAVSGRSGGVAWGDGSFFGEIAQSLWEGDEIDYAGPSGELTFSDVGDVQGDYMIWQVDEQANGDFAFVDRVVLTVATFDPK
jgi:ABC-type branched-subunit amino acid transport system substrate-binding protein